MLWKVTKFQKISQLCRRLWSIIISYRSKEMSDIHFAAPYLGDVEKWQYNIYKTVRFVSKKILVYQGYDNVVPISLSLADRKIDDVVIFLKKISTFESFSWCLNILASMFTKIFTCWHVVTIGVKVNEKQKTDLVSEMVQCAMFAYDVYFSNAKNIFMSQKRLDNRFYHALQIGWIYWNGLNENLINSNT